MGSWVPLCIGETNWLTVVPAEEMNAFACSSIHSNQCFPGSYLMLVTTVAKWRMCLRAMSIVNWGNMATSYFQSWDLFSCRFFALDGPKPADVIKWYTAGYSYKLISELARSASNCSTRHFVPAKAGKPYELGCALADSFLGIRGRRSAFITKRTAVIQRNFESSWTSAQGGTEVRLLLARLGLRFSPLVHQVLFANVHTF